MSKKRSKRWLKVMCWVGVVYGLFCLGLAWAYVHPPSKAAELPPGFAEISIPAEGHRLPCWCSRSLLEKGSKAATVAILVHGYGGSRAHWPSLMRELETNGIAVVVPAMSAHETNARSMCGFGPAESEEVIAAIRWVQTQTAGKPKIVLVGVSLGGAACWLASDLDPTVYAVVSEGAFARLDEITDSYLDKICPGGHILFRPVAWIASALAGVEESDVSPERAARKWRGRPCLVIQGAGDTRIPLSHAKRLAEASGGPLWVVPGARHAGCLPTDPVGYARHVLDLCR